MKKPWQIKEDIVNTIEEGAGKIDQLIEEFNNTVPVLNAAGFSVANFQVNINTPPGISIKIIGDITAIDVNALQTFIDENPDKKAMVLIMKGFQTSINYKDKITNLGMRYVVADITLSALPSIAVSFTKALA